MSMVAVLDALIVVLLATLVVLEIIRPRRLRRLLDEVDQRSAEATAALDAVQRRLERSMEAVSQESGPPESEGSDERRAEPRRDPSYRRETPPVPEQPEIELDQPVETEPQAQELREKIAHLLESSGSQRTERERRLLYQLQETLERPAGSDRLEQERMLYRALEAATQEAGPRPGGEPPEEERELIAKLRGG
ncbi:hypothetical protein [Thiohalorhabdus sp.]|uniref:hypothetical protein n=1 Tax=Thiohalorhabdus sp. TaxID=3094134 RepID=UPI002FC3D449